MVKKYGIFINHLKIPPHLLLFRRLVTGYHSTSRIAEANGQYCLECLGWQDIDLKHDFYDVDSLPENDRVRFTIHPDARKEVLKRLLELNHKIHEEEVKEGLWDKKTGTKKAEKEKSTGDQVNEPEEGYGGLFD